MAFTVSMIAQSVFGDKRVVNLKVTADTTAGTVLTPFNVIDFIDLDPVSAPTNAVVAINAGTSGTSIMGTVGMSSTANGNVYNLIVYGH